MRNVVLEAGTALSCIGISCIALAQINQAITDPELLDPWRQAAFVVQSVPADPSTATREAAAKLDAALAQMQARLEDTAIHIVARPEFAYDAAQWSSELAQEVERTGVALDDFYVAASLSDQPETVKSRESLDRLREILARRTSFERDVLATLGSGSKNAIQALSRRWWTASEQVEAVRKAAARLRE